MKKKFFILTLCFTLVFSSINYKRSYADGGVISLPILATVSSLAVATGIVIKNNDDLYDLGRMFYDYVKTNNDLTWDIVQTTFNSGIAVLQNGLVSTDSKFLDIVKDFFDNTFTSNNTIYIDGFPMHPNTRYFDVGTYTFGDLRIEYNFTGATQKRAVVYYKDKSIYSGYSQNFNIGIYSDGKMFFSITDTGGFTYFTPNNSSFMASIVNSHSFPYEGGYNWDNVDSKTDEDKSVALPIPGNLGHLVGQGSSDFWDNVDGLVGNDDISIPSIDNPSIGLDDVISFPNVEDVPSDTPSNPPSDIPFSNITEYIIGLVVPSDSYWIDTFGGLYNNFTSSFPMVDMDNFNNLVTGEKKFPNIDVNIMGVKGRVVNGDVVNSIVDWLRPIIAGFMMLCLMLFNYRKIYKTIRGVEPFQGIAQGTSDFRTGISEYNYMGSGLSKSDYEANQMELAKALYDYEQDTGKTYKIKI